MGSTCHELELLGGQWTRRIEFSIQLPLGLQFLQNVFVQKLFEDVIKCSADKSCDSGVLWRSYIVGDKFTSWAQRIGDFFLHCWCARHWHAFNKCGHSPMCELATLALCGPDSRFIWVEWRWKMDIADKTVCPSRKLEENLNCGWQ